MKATFQSYILNFKNPSGTSRGVLRRKESFFLKIESGDRVGWGEVGVLRGLSCDDRPDLEDQLRWTCENITLGLDELYAANIQFPSIQFALEQAFSHLENGFIHFESPFTEGSELQSINGLIWMGDEHFMKDQIAKRLDEGFSTLKMKVGAISWEQEKHLLESIRNQFSPKALELRVDANGAFDTQTALEVGRSLAKLHVHSIEQPVHPQDVEGLQLVAGKMAIPVALDESLIGVFSSSDKAQLLDFVRPQYIILKPSFIGGWRGSEAWIELATERNIGWWATSALESNVGLNAIAQWTYTKKNQIPQGLGTGSLYSNNIESPLMIDHGRIGISLEKDWDLSPLLR